MKAAYRVVNWSEYNRSLVNRGRLTVWMDEDFLKNWNAERAGKVGRPQYYHDAAIYFCYTIMCLFSLPLRQCQGFTSSIFELLNINLEVPHYSWICRRSKSMLLPNINNKW